MSPRRKTRKVTIGDDLVGRISMGGDAPVSVQTMTAGYTYDIDACVAEIHKLAAAGADLVRVAVPEKKDTQALKEILPQVSVPIVADVHFHFQRALEAIEAGVHKIRLNPGNINDRAQVRDVIQACKAKKLPIRVGVNEGSIVERKDKQKRLKIRLNPGNINDRAQVRDVIQACKAKKLPIRVGVNEGSIVERKDKQKRLKELGGVFSENKHGHFLAIMITKLEEYLEIFHAEDFHDIVISAKSIDPLLVIDAYKAISERLYYPLHLGVTHAGPKETGAIRSVVPLGHLLASGIGDTIRISYANDPKFEVEDGLELMYILGLRTRIGAELIACPTCGRIQVDLFKLVQDVRKQLATEIQLPIKVAVMGCVVNGPGECEGADIAIFAGDRRGIIYVQGEKVANVPEDDILPALLKECREFQRKVERGEAKLGEKKVDILPSF